MIYVIKHKHNNKFGNVKWSMPNYNKLELRPAMDQEQIYCTTDSVAALSILRDSQDPDWYVAPYEEVK